MLHTTIIQSPPYVRATLPSGCADVRAYNRVVLAPALRYNDPYSAAEAAVKDSGFSNPAAVFISNMMSDVATATFSHNLEWMTAEAIAGIDGALDGVNPNPFFLHFAPTNPHSSRSNVGALNDFTVRQTPAGNLDADPVSGMKARSTVIDRAPACTGARNCVSGDPDDAWVGVIGCDDALGALMAHLTSKGELDNTLIIVTQDHGQMAKESLYQGGIRTALFARYPPAIKAGTVVDTPVSNLDFAPTILELAGIDASFGIDGISWWTAASTEHPSASLAARECIISEINFDRAVVCGTLKYLSNWVDGPPKQGIITKYPAYADAEQIYDLATDPTEQTNLVAGGAQKAFREKAIAILKKHDADTAAASVGSLTTGTSKAPTTKAVQATKVPGNDGTGTAAQEAKNATDGSGDGFVLAASSAAAVTASLTGAAVAAIFL